jgi:hypothetical protein
MFSNVRLLFLFYAAYFAFKLSWFASERLEEIFDTSSSMFYIDNESGVKGLVGPHAA